MNAVVTQPPTPTALPSAMQSKLEAARAADAQNQPPTNDGQPPATPPTGPDANYGVTPPTNDGQPPATPPTPTAGDRVTLSRDEYNEMLARASTTQAAEGRAEAARLRLEDAQHRLTELAGQGKSDPAPPAGSPPALAVDVSGITITDEETEQFGESRQYIEKLVDLRVANTLNKLLPGITAQLDEAKNLATNVGTKLETQASTSFHKQATQAVPNMGELIKHKHWGDFLDETEPFSGVSFERLLTHNIANQNLDSLVKIYKAFEEKYVKPVGNTAGYNGATGSGGADNLPPEQGAVVKLKLSDRKRASEDYRKGRLSWDKLQEVNRAFDTADKQGNVDYNA